MEAQNSRFIVLPYKEYMFLQMIEMFFGNNPWYAGESLGRPPTPDEAVLYYIDHSGAVNFASRYHQLEALNEEGEKAPNEEGENE